MGDVNRQTALVGHMAAGTRQPRPTGGGGVSGADGPSGGPTRPEPRGGGWQAYAACWGRDPDLWFPAQGGSVRAAKRVCRVCPVQLNCLAEAMKRGEVYGVWGGASEDERRQIRTASRDERGGGVRGGGRAA